jgi:hypothetical protein
MLRKLTATRSLDLYDQLLRASEVTVSDDSLTPESVIRVHMVATKTVVDVFFLSALTSAGSS